MSDLKNTLVKNIIDKRYTRASSDLGVILKDKAYGAIDRFKDAFKLNIPEPNEPESISVTPEPVDQKGDEE